MAIPHDENPGLWQDQRIQQNGSKQPVVDQQIPKYCQRNGVP